MHLYPYARFAFSIWEDDEKESDAPPYCNARFKEQVLWPPKSLARWTCPELRFDLLKSLYDDGSERFRGRDWYGDELFLQTLELARTYFGGGTPGNRPSRYIGLVLRFSCVLLQLVAF